MGKEWFAVPRRLVGVMSGTSLDGVDVVVADFWRQEKRDHFRLWGWYHEEFPPLLRFRLRRLQEESLTIAEVAELHWELSEWTAESVRRCCQTLGIGLESVDAVGVHGQTVYHNPGARGERGYGIGLQLTNLSALAQWLEKTVVGDFRSADLAHGGEGAPLVPVFDWAFLRSDREGVVVLNIGGIANVTVLPPDCTPEQVRAWDTGPGNLWIDTAVELFFGKRYDEGGRIAQAGRLVPRLWEALQQLSFIRQPPPKSTGRELFSRRHLQELLQQSLPPGIPAEDVVHTLARFTAWSIAENLRLFAASCARLIVSGGGALNQFLMEQLQQELPAVRIERSEVYGIPVQAKEALCFAYLAYRTLGGVPGNLPSVTGARRAAVLGVIAQPGKGEAGL